MICLIMLYTVQYIQTLTTIMPPPPMATCLTFYPRDNNILAVGMDDLSILIYNVCTNKVYILLNLEKYMFHHLLQRG